MLAEELLSKNKENVSSRLRKNRMCTWQQGVLAGQDWCACFSDVEIRGINLSLTLGITKLKKLDES